ncbi:acyl-CoA dehydrogenase family protein [Streptomyces sp. NPDC101062]|uniref:acyl-CoA dehydrogenase family protein n=1 Tax=unclassified Streptomyces TaxID=2593676 RepID=UPI0037FFDD55
MCNWPVDRRRPSYAESGVSESKTVNLFHRPGFPSFLEGIYQGRFEWDVISDFVAQDSADEKAGDAVVERLADILRDRVNPTAVDATRELPEGLLEELRRDGFLNLQDSPDVGGLGLSAYNTFRVVQAAASWSVPVALVLGIQTAVGSGTYLRALPPGDLYSYVEQRLLDGIISGSADTEPAGASNSARQTRAVPTDDGETFLLTGEKIHIGNGPIADVVTVSAMLDEDGQDRPRLFFVETSDPGFRIRSRHEFMGVKGFPNAALVLDGVRVPRARMIVEVDPETEVRITPELTMAVVRGRLHLITAPGLAISKLCLEWSRNFLNRRTVDGRPLGDREEIQHMVSSTMADVFAIQALAEWSLLPADQPGLGINVAFEQNVTKAISAEICWRVADRTMDLLAGEGFETAPSKARRGVPALPLERFYRDARNLRISGGVSFLLQFWAARMSQFTYYGPDRARPTDAPPPDPGRPAAPVQEPRADGLDPVNAGHLRFAAAETRRLGASCEEFAADHPAPGLFDHQHRLIAYSRIADEILTMSVVLARAARLHREGGTGAQDLAHIYCARARDRLAGLWRQAEPETAGPGHAAVSDAWLGGDDRYASLTDGVITDIPPTADTHPGER